MTYESFVSEFQVDYDSRLELDLIDFCIYGPNGIGKTPVCAGVIDYEGTNKPAFIDLESGAASAKRMGIPVIDVQAYAAANDLYLKKPANKNKIDIYKALLAIIDRLEKQRKKCIEEDIEFPFNVIVLDGYTKLAEVTMESVMDSDPKAREVPDIQHWNYLLHRIRKITNRLRLFPTHLIATANEYTRQVSGVEFTGLDINPRTMNTILSNFGLIGRMKLVNGEPVLTFKPLSSYISRDRLNLMPKEMKKPSIKEIFTMYLEEKNKVIGETKQ